jgi:nicotinamide riboside kinase
MCVKIALLGAESTGKTQLATDLVAHLRACGLSALQVPEVLREWCDEQGRTPRPHEQAFIAQAQADRVNLAAIYSHKLFADASLYHFALAHQSSYDLTLVTALDLPWVADGLQRDGVHVREPVDAMLRLALESGKTPYQVIYGKGLDRLQNSINAINSIARIPIPDCGIGLKSLSNRMRNWVCEKCSDPDCEHVIFRNLLQQQTG